MVFTKENQLVIIFIIFTVIIGSGVALVRYVRPGLFMGKPDYIAGSDSVKHKALPVKITEKSRLVDEEQIVVPSSSDSDLIDINSATVGELQQLPQIGPVMAKRIVEYRKRHHRFVCIEQIMEVRGIGEKTFEKLKDKVVVY